MDNSKLYIGILSGTSMDSIDCGIYRFSNNHHEMLAFYEYSLWDTSSVFYQINPG